VNRLVVTRDQTGSHALHVDALHVADAVLELTLTDLPLWLQHPEPQPPAAPKPPTRRAKAAN
jgi:hypothetical protein